MAKSSKGKDQTALKKKATAVAAQRGNKKKKRGSMKEYFKGVKLEMIREYLQRSKLFVSKISMNGSLRYNV